MTANVAARRSAARSPSRQWLGRGDLQSQRPGRDSCQHAGRQSGLQGSGWQWGTEAGGAVYSVAYTLLQRQAILVIADSILSGSSTGDTPTSDVVSYQPVNLLPASCTDCANQATATLMFAGAANIVQQLLVIGGSTSGPTPIAADPLLQPLADNGGPTMTFGLRPGSPALDVAGPQVHPETFSLIVVDQRGISRPADLPGVGNGVGNGTDLGAFEFQCSAITLPSSALPNGTLNTAYAHTFTATGGTAPYSFFATALPPGLSLTSTGQLTGTPTAGGIFEFTVGVSDAYGCTNNEHYSLTIADSTCGISSRRRHSPSPSSRSPISRAGTSGGGKYILSVTAGALPPGLQLASASGRDRRSSASRRRPGTYSFTITAAKSGTTCRAVAHLYGHDSADSGPAADVRAEDQQHDLSRHVRLRRTAPARAWQFRWAPTTTSRPARRTAGKPRPSPPAPRRMRSASRSPRAGTATISPCGSCADPMARSAS